MSAAIIHEYLSEARDAASAADIDEVDRLLMLVHDKVALELQWQAEYEAGIARTPRRRHG